METGKNAELLAPAGSFDICRAVINAGADAVYLGGQLFGARAYAGNLNEEELLEAIRYAHIRNAKIYLTVNTLLKQHELDSGLVSYLRPFVAAGLDAVLVQDFGVFRVIREAFPDLPVHASTQMTVTGAAGVQELEKMGAARVVLSRELSLEEIRSVHQHSTAQLETFVHGALCYCYSGQCLLSSMRGNRSGNRGRCAQPCRLRYTAEAEDGAWKQEKETCLLSPKDICTLEILPDILEAGVYSLKIEGRMKNVTYAAGVTALYRKYLDQYLQHGRKGYHVQQQDVQDLMDIYNRGAFTTGYYQQDKGKEMLSLQRPNHMGTKALQVVYNQKGRVTFQALEPIHPQDVFEIDTEHSFTSGQACATGETMTVNLPARYRLAEGRILFRVNNSEVIDEVRRRYVEKERKCPVTLSFTAKPGAAMRLEIRTADARKITAVCEGDCVEKARKQETTRQQAADKLGRMGDSPFSVDQMQIDLAEGCFLPVGQLNALRRQAVEACIQAILADSERPGYRAEIPQKTRTDFPNTEKNGIVKKNLPVNCLVYTQEALQCLLSEEKADGIYLDYHLFQTMPDRKAAVTAIRAQGKKLYVALPYLVREKKHLLLEQLLQQIQQTPLDGLLVRNLEELGILNSFIRDDRWTGTRNLRTDFQMYVCNAAARQAYQEQITGAGWNYEAFTLPAELTEEELHQLEETAQPENPEQTGTFVQEELRVYGRTVLMQSEQCVAKTCGHCSHGFARTVLTDGQGHRYPLFSFCDYCHTILFDEKPVCLLQQGELLTELHPQSIRYEFTTETPEEIKQILEGAIPEPVTQGHWKTGIL